MIETAITELTAAINGHAATLQATNALLTSLLSALPGAAQTVVAPAAATEPEAPKPAAPKKAKAAAPTPAPAPEPTPEPEEENDVYKVAASAMFNVPYAEVTNAQRCKARDRMLAMGNNSGDDSAKAEPTPEPTPEPKVEAPAQPAKDPKKEAERLRSEIRSEYSTGCAAGGNQYKEFFRSTLKTHGGVDPSTATGISVQKIPEASLAACLADIKSYSA